MDAGLFWKECQQRKNLIESQLDLFLFSKGEEITATGGPYLAKFPDSFGNLCFCQVAQPAVILRYFNYSNQVDVYNQARQYDLVFEMNWVTHYGWFCLYIAIIGMTLVDCWKIGKTMCCIKQDIYNFIAKC